MLDDKLYRIRAACSPFVGSMIERFETAQILNDAGSWEDWPDQPLRIYFTDGRLLSVSWSRFDDLWLADDASLPFVGEGATMRWITDGIENLNGALGCTIHGVSLGRGSMSIESREIEIWTRLAFDLNGPWLEVFNALDENGYAFHAAPPAGEFLPCL